MLNADGTLVFAGAAGGALEDRFLGDSGLQNGRFVLVAVLVQIKAKVEGDQLGIELFAGVVGRAMLCAAAAFDAGIGLEGGDPGDVFT